MSSVPSTKPGIRRQALLMGIGFVAALFLGDYLLTQIPLPRVYGSTNEARWKWELYEQSGETPDVVFLGCSYALCGVSPKTVDAEVLRLTNRPATSLNLAASASSLFTQSLLVRRITESGRLPKLVYLGVTPNSVDALLRPWLANGLTALGEARDLPLATSADIPLFWTALRTALFRSHYQWRDSQIIARYTAIGAPLMPRSKLQRDDRGWAKWVGGKTEHDPPVEPAATDATEASARAGFENENINGRAIRRAIETLRSAGVAVRLLEMPMASTARRRVNPLHNSAYRAFIDEAVAATHAPIVRAPHDLVGNEDFFDDGHMNATGAEKFSRWLATDVVRALAQDVALQAKVGIYACGRVAAAGTGCGSGAAWLAP